MATSSVADVRHHGWATGRRVTLTAEGLLVNDLGNVVDKFMNPWSPLASGDGYTTIVVELEPKKPKWRDYELVKDEIGGSHEAWFVVEDQQPAPLREFLDRADIKRIGYVFKLPNGDEVVRVEDRMYIGSDRKLYAYWSEGRETLEPVAIRVEG